MLEEKKDIIHLFGSSKTTAKADFIAIRIEENKKYYLQKCRVTGFSNLSGVIVDEELFLKIFKSSRSPIVLSNSYTKINSKIDDEIDMRNFYLSAAHHYNHGCNDSAILRDNGDGTCVVIEVKSCHNCWQSGHDIDHQYMVVGDVFDISEILKNPDLLKFTDLD